MTISIAAYNVEKYIRKALDSLLDDRIIDDLEIFVVDDGGTDKTFEIAQEYAERYPESIFPIHKENGGYGSTINTSIELATGKYFKQLDGDDWYQTENLIKFVDLLRYTSTDCVVSYYYICNDNNGKYSCKKDFFYVNEGEYQLSDINLNGRFSIKNVTYKTELLKHMKESFTEHCFYTDAEFAVYPVIYVNSIFVCHIPVYVYRIGSGEQSIGKSGIRKHYREQETVFWNVAWFYTQNMSNEKLTQQKIILSTLEMLFYDWHKFRLYLPFSIKRITEMRAFENHVNKICPEIIQLSKKKRKTINVLINSNYIAYPVIYFYYLIKSIYV